MLVFGGVLSEMETSFQYPTMLGASPVSVQEISRIVTWERNIPNWSENLQYVYKCISI